jgi:hypothetical protein
VVFVSLAESMLESALVGVVIHDRLFRCCEGRTPQCLAQPHVAWIDRCPL